jgi:hypothetical protein
LQFIENLEEDYEPQRCTDEAYDAAADISKLERDFSGIRRLSIYLEKYIAHKNMLLEQPRRLLEPRQHLTPPSIERLTEPLNSTVKLLMESTVFISIAGLLITVTTSGIGFYFSPKVQQSLLRQELYKKQIEYLTEFVIQATRLQTSRHDTQLDISPFKKKSTPRDFWTFLLSNSAT